MYTSTTIINPPVIYGTLVGKGLRKITNLAGHPTLVFCYGKQLKA
jgi:hypothetical protein